MIYLFLDLLSHIVFAFLFDCYASTMYSILLWLHNLNANHYLQVSAVESLEGPLLQVEGLSDLRLELHSKKLNIHLVLIDELHRHLYIKSTSRLGHKNKDKNAARILG